MTTAQKSRSRIYGKTQVDYSEIHPIEVVLLALILCISTWVWAYPWNVISVFLTSLLLAITIIGIIHRWWKGRQRIKLLRNPVETKFWIPPLSWHRLDYVAQDDEEKEMGELTLPADSEVDILVRMNPRIDFVINELQFGCGGDVDKKPEPLSYFNPYIKRGLKSIDPEEEGSGHYVDRWNMYHMKYLDRTWSRGTVRITGLKMKTKSKGVFPFTIVFFTNEGEGKSTLSLRVK